MTKALLSIVLICYMTVTSGVVINFHYCMNKLASTQLYGGEKKLCSRCGMHVTKSHGCCHDEVKIVKLQVDQQKASLFAMIDVPALLSVVPSAFILIPSYNVDEINQHPDHSPPLSAVTDLCLQNSVFRI